MARMALGRTSPPLTTGNALLGVSPNSSGLEGHVLKTRRAGTSDLG